MKKLRNLCIAIIALVGLSNTTFAQSSGTAPNAGASHSYYVNSADGTTYSGTAGHKYAWYVTKNDLTSVENSDLTLVSATASPLDGMNPVVDLFKVNITWKTAAIGHTYYIHVVETNLDDCQNHKVMKVIPANDFRIAFRNVSRDAGNNVIDAVDNFEVCAPDVQLTLDGSKDVVYGYGSNTVIYKLSASNISPDASWTVNYDISESTDNTVSATYGYLTGTTISNEGTLDVSGDPADFNVNAGTADVYVVITIVNNGATDAEGLTKKDYIFSLNSGADVSSNPAKIINAVDSSVVTGELNKTQSVKARPDTQGINTI